MKFEDEMFKIGLEVIKHHRELEGLAERRAEVERKAADPSLSEIVRKFHKDSLRQMDENKAKASSWLAVNVARLNQFKTEADIAANHAGEMLCEIYSTENEAYAAFRKTLEKADL
jgi:hypothetical protein